MSDHRKATRKKLMAFAPVYDASHKALLGYVRNLSLLGVMVVGEKTVEINTNKVLKIEFPNDLHDLISTNITIPARVAWCKQDETLKYFDTGFEFTDVTPEQTKAFQTILARYQFRQDMPNY
jgi:c-di-GMP-binding flagellar brake protein YcgR